MNLKRSLIFLALLLLLSGCSGKYQVYTDADPDMDVLVYKSYAWSARTEIESRNNPLLFNELTDKRIRRAVDQQLHQNGYVSNDGKAELSVHYHIVVKDKSMVRLDNPDNDSYSPYWLEGGRDAYRFKEGTLIIDLMDASSCNIIWRGWAVGVVEEESPTLTEAEITEAVEKIFQHYPRHPRK